MPRPGRIRSVCAAFSRRSSSARLSPFHCGSGSCGGLMPSVASLGRRGWDVTVQITSGNQGGCWGLWEASFTAPTTPQLITPLPRSFASRLGQAKATRAVTNLVSLAVENDCWQRKAVRHKGLGTSKAAKRGAIRRCTVQVARSVREWFVGKAPVGLPIHDAAGWVDEVG